eukprot:1343122-Prorocentrum_lima.AAC.1
MVPMVFSSGRLDEAQTVSAVLGDIVGGIRVLRGPCAAHGMDAFGWMHGWSSPANFAVQAKFSTPLVGHAVSSSNGCGA